MSEQSQASSLPVGQFLVYQTEGEEVEREATDKEFLSVRREGVRSARRVLYLNLFETVELDEKAVCRDFRHTDEDGKD
jgi:dihydrodipicolinate reductase